MGIEAPQACEECNWQPAQIEPFEMVAKSFHIQTDESPGLKCDADIIANALAGKFGAKKNICTKWNWNVHFQRILLKIKKLLGFRDAIGVFVEDIRPRWLSAFSVNILIPNQEWMRPGTVLSLKRCDEVWCKTKYAQALFTDVGCKTRYIGFTSIDRYAPDMPKNFDSYIHVQGRSGSKGTATILEAWGKNPQWPVLTIVTRDTTLVSCSSHNIKVVTDFLTDSDLNQRMNSSGVHLCTSEAEGFGHSINEALSTGALVISTNAPPMNELVQPEFGLLVPFASSSPAGLGEKFKISVNDLAHTIEKSLVLSWAEKERMGQAARAAYLKGQRDFQAAILNAAEYLS